MNGLIIAITTLVCFLITLVTLTLEMHYKNLYFKCEVDPLLWCSTNWKCDFGTNDANNNLVGTESTIPMKCYLKGLYGRIDENDENDECRSYYATYNRSYNKCYPDVNNTALCDTKNTDELYPCNCATITNGKYGNNYFGKIGFVVKGTTNANVKDSIKSCSETNTPMGPGNGCWNLPEIFCNQFGKQINSCPASDPLATP